MSHQYYLKDKKIEIWRGEAAGSSYGVTKYVYKLAYSGLWAYYRQLSGNVSLDNAMTIRIYDSTERAVFVINRIPTLRDENRAMLKIRFNGKVYDILQIDDYEGYRDDLKITAEYSSTQSYNGMDDETETT